LWRINISKVSNNKRSYIELETVTKRESLYIFFNKQELMVKELSKELVEKINNGKAREVEFWKEFLPTAEAAVEILEKAEISLEDLWYLPEEDRKDVLKGVHYKPKADIYHFLKIWNPSKTLMLNQNIKSEEEGKIRNKFDMKYPTYKGDSWTFLQELDAFMEQEDVTVKETFMVVKKSISLKYLPEIK
jgi:hypothetical protein